MLVSLNDINGCPKIDIKVKKITVPAELSKVEYLKNIFIFLKKNRSIDEISICDDYLDPEDVDTKYFCERISEDLPKVKINWIRELKIDGRHGR